MPVKIQIPAPLRSHTDGQDTVTGHAGTVQAVLAELGRQFPAITDRLFDEKQQLRRFVNIFVNDEDIRFMDGPATQVNDGDTVAIIPAVAGG
jgi:molybdopterin converting factor small subunit